MDIPELKTRYRWAYREDRESTGVRVTPEWIDEILRSDAIQGWYREVIEAWKENGNEPITVDEMMGLGMPATLMYHPVSGLQSVLRKEGFPVIINQHPYRPGPRRNYHRSYEHYLVAIRRHAMEVSYVVMFVHPPARKTAQSVEGVERAQ